MPTPMKGETMTETDTETLDPQGAAERVVSEPAPKKGKPGRPKGSGKKTTGEKSEPPEKQVVVINVTPADIVAAGQLGALLWNFAAPFAKMAPLNEDQTHRLGEALAPLVQKYLPLLGNWQYEIGAVIVIFALVNESRAAYEAPKPPGSEAEIIPDAPPDWKPDIVTGGGYGSPEGSSRSGD